MMHDKMKYEKGEAGVSQHFWVKLLYTIVKQDCYTTDTLHWRGLNIVML
jgi:hypothetical protein